MPTPFIYHRFINETDLDFFNHVNHAKYLVIYEETRWAWLREKGIDLHTLRSKNEGIVILNVNINYKREITSGQTIRIETYADEIAGKTFKINQKMFNTENKECSNITITVALFDLKQRSIIEPNEYWKNIFNS